MICWNLEAWEDLISFQIERSRIDVASIGDQGKI